MMEIDYGGSAFPAAAGTCTDMEIDYGMSLRDWFAGQALAGNSLGKRHPNGGSMTDMTPKAIAQDCFRIADAMIEARKPLPTTTALAREG